jgi:plasmid stabilization system protein ParE
VCAGFFIDEDLRGALAAIKERDGISESEQIRRAIKAWVEKKGVPSKAGRKRASTRKLL